MSARPLLIEGAVSIVEAQKPLPVSPVKVAEIGKPIKASGLPVGRLLVTGNVMIEPNTKSVVINSKVPADELWELTLFAFTCEKTNADLYLEARINDYLIWRNEEGASFLRESARAVVHGGDQLTYTVRLEGDNGSPAAEVSGIVNGIIRKFY